LAAKNKETEKLITVENILKDHWNEFGRNYYQRYDIENIETAAADKIFQQIAS